MVLVRAGRVKDLPGVKYKASGGGGGGERASDWPLLYCPPRALMVKRNFYALCRLSAGVMTVRVSRTGANPGRNTGQRSPRQRVEGGGYRLYPINQ